MLTLRYRALGAALLFVAAGAVHAQYVWIGANGTRQYSDKPPPPDIPASKIIKGPGRAATEAQPDVVPTVDGTPSTAAKQPKGPPTLADREKAYQERTKAREEQDGKNRDEAERRQQLAERCKAARETQAQLASGQRIAQFDRDGQKSYMSDEERANRTEQANRALQECR